jgi:hypothetical protein
VFAWLAAVLILAGGTAFADSVDKDKDKAKYSHKGQFGISAQFGVGARAIFPYNDEFCGTVSDQGQSEVCLGRSPVTLDVGLAYGVLGSLDVMLDLRLGVERDFGVNIDDSGPRIRALAPGVKAFFGEDGGGKFFSTLQLVVDLSGYDQADETDLGARNQNGFQFDLHETVGLMLWVGETVAWRRWLRFELDGGVGLQARFP